MFEIALRRYNLLQVGSIDNDVNVDARRPVARIMEEITEVDVMRYDLEQAAKRVPHG